MTKTWKITNGDIVRLPGNTGYYTVEGREKCRQDVQNSLSTDSRDSTNLGCGLDECIGVDADNPASAFSSAPAAFEFQTRVRAGLNRLKATQKQFQFSERTAQELIYDVGPVQIWPIAEDTRNFRWRVDIMTIDGRANFTVNGSTR